MIHNKWLKNEPIDLPRLTVAYDMGWQQRSSGRKYDSNSGHGLIIGMNTKKVIGFKIKSKKCKVYAIKQKNLTYQYLTIFVLRIMTGHPRQWRLTQSLNL